MSYEYIKEDILDDALFSLYSEIIKFLDADVIKEECIKEFVGISKEDGHRKRAIVVNEILLEMEKRGYNKGLLKGE